MPPKKFHFTPSLDIVLLQEVSACNPWATRNGWIQVSNSLKQLPAFRDVETKTVRERTRLLMSRFRRNDMAGIRKSGTEEEYGEREILLQELCDKEKEFSEPRKRKQSDQSSAIVSRNKAARMAPLQPPFVPGDTTLSVSIPAIDEAIDAAIDAAIDEELLDLEAIQTVLPQSPLQADVRPEIRADIRLPIFGLPGPSASTYAASSGIRMPAPDSQLDGETQASVSGLASVSDRPTSRSDRPASSASVLSPDPSSAPSDPAILSPGRITRSTFLQHYLSMRQSHFETEMQLKKEDLEIRKREVDVASNTAKALLQLVQSIAEVIKK